MSDFDATKIRRVDGGLLLVFHELMRLRRAGAVAERIGLSAPAVSHALARLRDLFEDPLFVRRPHGLEPTRRALELAPQVEAIIRAIDGAVSPDRGFEPALSRRRFTASAPEFVTALVGPSLIRRLGGAAPGVTFAIVHLGQDEAFGAVRDGRIDFALGRFERPRPGFDVEILFEDVYCVAARRGHPGIEGRLSEAQWREIGHVFAWSGSETTVEEHRGDAAVALRAAVPQWLTALALVGATDTLATAPRRLVQRYAQPFGLQVLELPVSPERIEVGVLRRSGQRDPGVDWFLAQVKAAALDS